MTLCIRRLYYKFFYFFQNYLISYMISFGKSLLPTVLIFLSCYKGLLNLQKIYLGMLLLVFIVIIQTKLIIVSLSATENDGNGTYPETSYDDEKSEESTPASTPSLFEEEATEKIHSRYELTLKGTLRQFFTLDAGSQDPSSNVVCSPVTALLPLGKLALGADNDSREELYEIIGVSDENELSSSFKKLIKELKYLPGVKLIVISRLFVSDEVQLKSKFIEACHKIFESDVQKISFISPNDAAKQINDWISKETNGKISLLLNSNHISPASSLVIVNAICFNASWKEPFEFVDTASFNSPTGKKTISLMSLHSKYNYVNSGILGAQIVEIPYQDMATSLIVVLPQAMNNGLPSLIKKLKSNPELLNDALSQLQNRRVILSIPKFQISTTLNLTHMYEKVGMWYVSSRNRSGLTQIAEHQELVISSAVQKVVIEVHETGTEGAARDALTTKIPTGFGLAEIPVILRVDRPFLFYLQANGEQLFGGFYIGP